MWCLYIYIYTHSGILLSHKNKIMGFVKTLMDLDNIMLSEINHTEKVKY